MTPVAPPRPLAERIADTRHLLETTVDAWVATADPSTGRPWMVPLSFAWTSSVVVLGTGADSRTVLNALAQPWIFAERSGFDPRGLSSPYAYLRVRPRRIQAWREENELDEREIMRDGRWLG